ncbi:hypothetical protein M3649_08830 [Ureibacillus chungkukjangi]|uniref:hypothetical protein n=1 Tax=Ureibacillus chungkukjangi TaxID=1202712 RepID=UPI00203E1B1D|nr:hypothetical protein [Ureibacillus chungkukjangi]MCM3388237.1 hypothetical protein [Ureibacillus chungkukjangi]
MNRNVIWSIAVREKLLQFKSERFTTEETLEFITHLILETDEILKNGVIGQTYTEEFGKYAGISRIVVKKFRIYYKKDQHNFYILAILFPGEK